jgi:3alpha(or 20beta)-hydroxysteroid dehydrogenase
MNAVRRLSGKVAIVTGAARGMGAAHARGFVAEGARVVLTDVRAEQGRALAALLGADAAFVEHDVADAAAWARVVAFAEQRFGPVNVLVNNAGILGPIARAADLAEADYLRVIAVNQHSVFLGMHATIPSMLKAGGGSIVNVSSISGLIANYGAPSVAYVGSKFAVRGMSKAAAIEYGRQGIRVNSVHPGFIRTPMMVEGTDESGGDAASLIPMGRIAEPEEVTRLVVFLASDESSYVTAAEYVIDAGLSAC